MDNSSDVIEGIFSAVLELNAIDRLKAFGMCAMLQCVCMGGGKEEVEKMFDRMKEFVLPQVDSYVVEFSKRTTMNLPAH